MILMYHKVDVIAPTIWWVTPEELDAHLTILGDREFVYLDDYASPETQVVITFDDAYENVGRHALPVLRAHGVPFEVFVVGDLIGDWNEFDPQEPRTRHMGMADLDQVVRSGGRVQWHSWSHPHLPDLDEAGIETELTVPDDLRERFPAPQLRWFSYPGGAYDERSLAVARRRFAGAVSVVPGPPGDRWQMSRVMMDRHTSLPDPGRLAAAIAAVTGSSESGIRHYWDELPGPMWFSAADIYARQVARVEDGGVFVELGAWKGRGAAFMGVEIANSGKAIRFLTVDHWRGSDEEAHVADADVRAGRLYEVFLANIDPVSHYVTPIREESVAAAEQFEDDSVDFVYVDAGHTYEDVRTDLTAWWPKLKQGGVMAGDDWLEDGVQRAVSEFFEAEGVEVGVEPGRPNPEWSQWVVERPPARS
jgi:peptidoglycan/xylan/chitin deacetylase (PgdA/CDA1 family)/predicted O-methyltransferase YrrM